MPYTGCTTWAGKRSMVKRGGRRRKKETRIYISALKILEAGKPFPFIIVYLKAD
jgi:hypothetical protein